MSPIAFIPGAALSLRGKARRRARRLYPQAEVLTVDGKRVWGHARAGRRPRRWVECRVGFYAQIVCSKPGYLLEITL